MPCTIKIRLVEARDLPVMDRTSKLADAYVGITFASFEAKSSVSKKTLNPKWDEEFRFDVADDSVLQSQPIEFKLMDHDVYTSDAVRVSTFVCASDSCVYTDSALICAGYLLDRRLGSCTWTSTACSCATAT